MEGEHCLPSAEEWRYCNREIMSPDEIVEIGEDSKSFTIPNSIDGLNDIYVAVGKDDLDVLKWVLDHSVSLGTRVFLVHVFPPITYIPTPVGKLARSQMSQEQARFYINQESNKRRNLLNKYIRLCLDAKLIVDTMLLESNDTAKAILDLIPVLNITKLIMGTKRSPTSGLFRRPRRNHLGNGERVKKHAPDYCEVTIVCEGQKVLEGQQVSQLFHSSLASNKKKPEISERNFFECVCFSGKFN